MSRPAYPVAMASTSPIPPAMRAASEWAWRLLVIAGAVVAFAYLLGFVSEAVIPVVVATLLAAMLSPVNGWLRARLGRKAPAAALTVLTTVAGIGLLLFLIGSQLTGGFTEMAGQVTTGLDQIRVWVRDTLHISDTQLAGWIDQGKTALTTSEGLRGSLARAGLGATHVIAGTFIALFALFFFLYEGERIWAWLVRLFPRTARERVAGAGVVAWGQLTAFTRATIIVALVDAVGITVVALLLRVPFALAIGALVFLTAFVPIVGAFLSGMVAVLIALVAQGPVAALLMLLGVLAVQQIESHVLQPFLLGKAVNVHPLAVILSVATGAVVAGIVGTLVAVPTAAVVNAVGKFLLSSPDGGGSGEGASESMPAAQSSSEGGPDGPETEPAAG